MMSTLLRLVPFLCIDRVCFFATLSDLDAEQAEHAAFQAMAETKGEDVSITRLKLELQASEEHLRSMNEELETSNEELKSSKEELQSVNEELSTVNAELQSKVIELSRANNDMNNLLAGTGIGTVFVDHHLNILRFTPSITKIINLISSDIGRPVGHIVSNLAGYDGMVPDTQAVLDTLIAKEVDVETLEGKWYTMRIQPYRTLDNVIEGAVITFVEVSNAKKMQETLRLQEERLRVALQATSLAVSSQDKDLRYTWIQDPFFTFRAEQVLGRTDSEIFPTDVAATITAIKQPVLVTGKGVRR